ncbi:kelch repeat and BTB domain-containing protein 13 isoform X2 [Xyrauchen texanus]|uniref:kelch repeat and BTB domain-containing protein 13 isoform X2 n=1 Tax=Xyrauchen texanus TaxID=154827 RepID=UPI00224235B3|nr:kelch repeat and BTB domain-containing protein 13 isoform X2 [Xyrauchen texanus]
MGPPCSLGQSRDSVTRIEDSAEGQDEESTRVLRVCVEESVFPIDRAVLGQKCEYFRALFRSGMKDSQQSEFHLQGGLKARGFLIAMAVFRASVYGLWRLFHTAAVFIRDAYFDLQEAVKALPEDMVCYVESLSPASFVALGTHSPSMKILQDSYRTVFYLDEKQGAWKYLTDLPTDASTSMAGVAVVGNRLYIVGGVRGVSKETVDLSFSYDTETNKWSVFDGPQQSRYNFTLVGHNEHLYAIGGEFDKIIMSSVEVCDVSTGAWTFCKQTPRSVAGVASAVARRRIFVCFWKPPDTTDIYEYVPSNDEWTLTTTMVKPQSYGHCMVAHGDSLYVMRNGPCDDFLRCLMDCYNITTGQWTAIPGHYVNSRGALFTAVVRGDSAFTVNHNLTLEFLICGDKWKPRRQMTGFPKSGSLWTCLLRLPKSKDIQQEIEKEEAMVIDVNVESVEALLEANYTSP